MKTSELLKILKDAGCYLIRNGSNHDIYKSPVNEKQFPVPRHKGEVPSGTANKILKEAGIR